MEKSDEEIVIAVQNGESEAFGLLISRYEKKILGYGRRFLYQYEDVEDAVQDTFLKAYTNIQSFKTDMRFSPWIYRIAHNTFINLIKKRGREPLTLFDPDTLLGSVTAKENPEKELLQRELGHEVEAALQTLPPKYREPLILYFYEDKDYKEIADIMHIPTSTVGVRIKRGKEKLKRHAHIEQYGQ